VVSGSVLDVIVISFEKEVLQQVSDLLSVMTEINNVLKFDSLPKAEKYLGQRAADFVLLDADDDENGWIIPYKRMKAYNPAEKIVLMSRSRDAAVKAYETGVWDYLLKPVKESQLKRVIEKCR
jgi:two-component SAPR family response regulator